MKVVYSVPVVGALRTEHSLRFSLDGREIDLICGKGGLLERVIYTVKSDAEAYGPKIEVHEDRNPRVHIIEQLDPNLQRAIQELHNLEANLSMFGVEGFDFDFAEVRWIPETDPEKQHVHVLGVKREPDGVVPPSEITPPSLLASIYLHCLSSYDLEIPLTFFRKGDSLFRERRYLEALPNFCFWLSTSLQTESSGRKRSYGNIDELSLSPMQSNSFCTMQVTWDCYKRHTRKSSEASCKGKVFPTSSIGSLLYAVTCLTKARRMECGGTLHAMKSGSLNVS